MQPRQTHKQERSAVCFGIWTWREWIFQAKAVRAVRNKSLNMLIEDREVSVMAIAFCLVLLESLVYLAWFF
jgi:hypothetical protein